jgi:hypothetical protein
MAQHHCLSPSQARFGNQVCTIAVCGLAGIVALMILKTDSLLRFSILSADFVGPILWSSVSLFFLIGLHAAAICVSRNRYQRRFIASMDGQGYRRLFGSWRYAVVMVPLALSGLLVYCQLSGLELLPKYDWGSIHQMMPEEDPTQTFVFAELIRAGNSADPRLRASLDGTVGYLKGFFSPVGEKEFDVVRSKLPQGAIKIRAIAPKSMSESGFRKGDLIKARGRVEFRKLLIDAGHFVPVVVIENIRDLTPLEANGIWYEWDE